MTLISAFRCERNRIVLHADSEENHGGFRKSVQKIVPRKMGGLDVIIAGSGIAELIDGFTDRLKERLDKDQASDINDVKSLIEKRLPNFYGNEVANYPVTDHDKLHTFIVAAYSPSTKQFEVWGSRGTRLIPVTSYELAGIEEIVYDHVASRLYKPEMSVSEAVLAGSYLFAVAEATSSLIRSPISVVVVWEQGIWTEPEDSIHTIQQRLRQYESELNHIFLACADIAISVPDLEDKLNKFKETVLNLHREHLDLRAATMSLMDLGTKSPIPQFPKKTPVSFGPRGFKIEHEREKINQSREEWGAIIDLAEKLKKNKP